MKIARITLLASASLLGACGGGYSPESIIDQAPQGLMEGEDWTMVSAVVTDDGDSLSVDLYPIEVEPCDGFASSDSSIIFSVPKEEGEHPLNFSFDLANNQTVTFVPAPGSNVIASQGLIVIEALSAEEVTIGLVADADDSSINGRFTTAVCPDPF